MPVLGTAAVLWCLAAAAFAEPACVIELDCAECVPDNMPVVTSHAGEGRTVRLREGEELTLWCAGGKFLAYPLRQRVSAACEAGRYRVAHDKQLRHLLALGCQENVFEDVLHEVEECPSPMQGRAYQMQEGGGARHLAALCFDADRALARFARMSGARRNALPLPPHVHTTAPLSLLGNFNHMFDATTRHQAQTLYSDDAKLNRILLELLKHDDFTPAAQTLTACKLLSPRYFEPQNARVADFVSNQFACWRAIAEGNLLHLQRDVARLLSIPRARNLGVVAGTHGVLALRTGHNHTEIYLKPEQRFPVPKYVWTVIYDAQNETAVALVVLNNPFVTISELKEAEFCKSVCTSLPWLRDLRRNHNYETPVFGLVFCCQVHDFISVVKEIPESILKDVTKGPTGLLTEFFV